MTDLFVLTDEKSERMSTHLVLTDAEWEKKQVQPLFMLFRDDSAISLNQF